MSTTPLAIGQFYSNVMLETCRDEDVTRPRVRCVSHFGPDLRVEFPIDLRTEYPIGTRFRATVKVCQKHFSDGSPKGAPYLRASDIGLIVQSIPDVGLRAKIVPGSVSNRAYFYIWDTI